MTMMTVGHWYTQDTGDLAAKAAVLPPAESALPIGWTPLRVLGAVAALREMGAQSEEFQDYCRRNDVTRDDVVRMGRWMQSTCL